MEEDVPFEIKMPQLINELEDQLAYSECLNQSLKAYGHYFEIDD